MVKWSHLGAYLSTFHPNVFNVHPDVQLIDFSPCEKSLVTFSSSRDFSATDEPQAIIIWDVLMGTNVEWKLCQLQWNPRPPIILSVQQQKDKTSPKKYSAQFKVKGRSKIPKTSKSLMEDRYKLMQLYGDHPKIKQEEYAAQRKNLMQMRQKDEEVKFKKKRWNFPSKKRQEEISFNLVSFLCHLLKL